MLINGGRPIIHVIDANYKKKGILYLKHIHIGLDLDIDKLKVVLKILYDMWKNPIYLETVVNEKTIIYKNDEEGFGEIER